MPFYSWKLAKRSPTRGSKSKYFLLKKLRRKSSRASVNVITFLIQPKEKITMLFWSKSPALLESLNLTNFLLPKGAADADTERIPDAYEHVIYDCIHGDHTLFTTTDEVLIEWGIICSYPKDI